LKENIMTKKNVITGALILAGIAIVTFFGIRAFRAFKHIEGHGPFHGKPPAANKIDVTMIRDWMTVPYIAHLYDVPPEAIFKALEIPKDKENGRKSLAQLNEKYYPGQGGIILADVQAVIQAFQKQAPPPPFPATPIFTPTAAP
jgi:hypothetical protein